MKIIRSAGALVLGALFLGAMAGPAFASPPGTVNNYASVTGGSLTADLAGDVTFPAVDASHSDTLAISQATGVEVNDLTATGAGWGVTVLASDLAGPNGTSILASNVSVVGYGALVAISGVATGVTAGSIGSMGSAINLVSAPLGAGMGDYTQAFEVGLNVPANSLAGSYAGTLTVTAAPLT